MAPRMKFLDHRGDTIEQRQCVIIRQVMVLVPFRHFGIAGLIKIWRRMSQRIDQPQPDRLTGMLARRLRNPQITASGIEVYSKGATRAASFIR